MMRSQVHRRKPVGKPMPQNVARANAKKSSIRAKVEHVFAHQKIRFGLFIRTIGIARAEAKLTLASLTYNFDRLIFHGQRVATGWVRLTPGENPRQRPKCQRNGPNARHNPSLCAPKGNSLTFA